MRSPLRPWQVISSEVVLSRRWIEIRQDRVKLASGHEIDEFHVVHAPSWAAVLCLTADAEVVLVRQYRHGIGAESLELPAGVIDRDESPLAAAQRELCEETGYVSDAWLSLGAVATEPSRHTVVAHFFFASGARATERRALDASEELETVRVPAAELIGLVERGEIVHGVHVGAILLAARRGLIPA
jgi:8-oxo-dGTP pyrophosphatase MutT (NUDIX family)